MNGAVFETSTSVLINIYIYIYIYIYISNTDVKVSNTDVEVFIPLQKTARCGTNGQVYYEDVAVEVLGVGARVGHSVCMREFLHVGHTGSLRGR